MKNVTQKCGYVAIIGKPNAGKSTLINSIIDDKTSIVTHKAQTTIANIIATKNIGNTQILFVDTPGIADKTYKNIIAKNIKRQTLQAIRYADVILYLVDAKNPNHHEVSYIIENINLNKTKTQKTHLWLAINKIDLVKRDKLLVIAEKLQQNFPFDKVWMISAKKNDGVADIEKSIIQLMPIAKWAFPKEYIQKISLVDKATQFILAEITREKILTHIHQEIPYNIIVKTYHIQKIKRKIHIKQTVYVSKNSHKSIIIGKNAAMIKSIGILSRKDITEKLQADIVLLIDVKTKSKDWINQEMLNLTNSTIYSNKVNILK